MDKDAETMLKLSPEAFIVGLKGQGRINLAVKVIRGVTVSLMALSLWGIGIYILSLLAQGVMLATVGTALSLAAIAILAYFLVFVI